MRHEFENARVLVTGGLGFIGSNLAIRLGGLGAHVTVLDSMVPEHGGNLANLDPLDKEIAINVSDMRDLNSLSIMVRDKDFIFHLAGQVSHGDSMRDPHGDLGVNCVSTMNLVEACRHSNPEARLIFTSTRQVYGNVDDLPVKEDHPTVPVDVNGINKLAAEYYHLLYHRIYGVRSAVLRLTNTYGPRQQIRNDRQGFIGIMIRLALKGEKIRIFGTGEQIRDFNYVDDVVEALLMVAMKDQCFGRVLNLGAPTHQSVLEFVKLLVGKCATEYEIVPFPEDKKIIDIGDYYGDYSALHELTGWEPRIDLDTGLSRSIDWFSEHRKDYWE
jgi:UDP-glucose 4-epimerase